MATTAAEGAATTGGGGGPSDHETTTPTDAVVAAALPSPSPLAPTPPPPPRTTTKRCDGPCGLKLDESGYSITMWSRGANRRRTCLVCSRLPPLPPAAPPLVVVGRGGGEEGSDDVRATAATTTATTRKRGATTTANLLAGGGIDDEEERCSAAPPPRSRRRRIIADGGGGASPTGDGGGSRAVRSSCCACRDPPACLELLRRWARLADEDGGGARVGVGRRAIEYVFLPRPSAAAGGGGVGRSATRAGRHADACRRVAFRGLGYGGDDGDDAPSPADAVAESGASRRVGVATGAEAPTDRPGEAAARTTTRRRERIALVHFHPDVVPYLLREGEVGVVSGGAGGGVGGGCCHGRRDGSEGRWRVPLDLGDAIGYAEGDACPDPDSNDLRTYFAVPNYSLESAAADVARAEERSRDRARTMRAEYASLTREVSECPGKVVSRFQDLRRANDLLASENAMLRERLGREGSTRRAMAAKAARLRRCIEKMARRLERLDTNAKGDNPTTSSGGRGRASQSSSSSSSSCRGNGRGSARAGCKDAAGQNLVSEEEINGDGAEGRPSSEDGDMGRSVAVRDGRGGRRWSDPRMDRAVEARWRNPSLSAEEALRIGGYVFPPMPSSSDDADGKAGAAAARREVVDSDNVSIAQRKNNLLRRLRLRRNALAAAAREGSGCDADVPLE